MLSYGAEASMLWVFFFQAEDGIRDIGVTGVQTCALPISSGAGGQHVNKTESAIRVTHLPTGIVVECQDSRSQHKNREKALGVLAARIRDKQLREQQAKTASTRKLLIGSGDRSERIRTYNFPQGRVTDHRINLTLYKIDRIMDGELDELIGALSAEQQAEQLAQLAEEAA